MRIISITPKVFISYSHDDESHEVWVKKLASDLLRHGVDVTLDQWDLRVGDDLPFFMEQGLSNNHLVICVCSERYVEKAENMSGGVGYEKMIISSKLLENANFDFIIPIIKNNPHKSLPTYLKTKFYIDFSNDSNYYNEYKGLLFRIHGEDLSVKPRIGNNPFSTDLLKNISSKISIDSSIYCKPELEGQVVYLPQNNDGIFTVGSGEYSFSTRWYVVNRNAVHVRFNNGLFGYLNGCTKFPVLSQIEEFDFTSSDRRLAVNDIIIWVNTHNKVMATRFVGAKSRTHGDNENEVTFEYKIYTFDDELSENML